MLQEYRWPINVIDTGDRTRHNDLEKNVPTSLSVDNQMKGRRTDTEHWAGGSQWQCRIVNLLNGKCQVRPCQNDTIDSAGWAVVTLHWLGNNYEQKQSMKIVDIYRYTLFWVKLGNWHETVSVKMLVALNLIWRLFLLTAQIWPGTISKQAWIRSKF